MIREGVVCHGTRAKRKPEPNPDTSASSGPEKAVAFLAKVASKFATVLSLPDLLQYVIRALREDVGFDSCSVALLDDEGTGGFVIRAASGLRTRCKGTVIPRGHGVHGAVATGRKPLYVSDMTADPRVYRRDTGAGSGIYAPLVTRGRVTGILSAVRPEPAAFEDKDLDVLVAVAGYLAGAVEAARLHERLREQATTDGLTGLANHRTLRRALDRELRRARRSEQPISIVFVEIDGFKKINDDSGHLHGDQILRSVATVLRRSCRETDLVARFGGDEFVLLLPQTETKNAARVAERVRRSLAEIQHVEGTRVTASLGIATCVDHGTSGDALLESADRAMYQAKRAGGDRVGIASTALPS